MAWSDRDRREDCCPKGFLKALSHVRSVCRSAHAVHEKELGRVRNTLEDGLMSDYEPAFSTKLLQAGSETIEKRCTADVWQNDHMLPG